MKKVLLTGASGFIGRHCLPLLAGQQFEVHAISTGEPPSGADRTITWHQADLLDSAQLQRVVADVGARYLLHLAWYTRHREYWTSDKNFEWVRTSLDLLTQFGNHGGQRVVIAGSCAEYDWRYGYCAEDITPLIPATLYGTCKHSLNLMFKAYTKNHGLSSAWGRIFYVYGPHEYKDRLVPSVVQSLLREEPAICSSGDQVRDFLHVEDVAAAFVALLDSDLRGDVNIASGNPRSIKELASSIALQIGRPDLLRFAAQAQSQQDAFVVARTARLHEELSFSPRYELEQGLHQTIEWWKQRTRVKPESMAEIEMIRS